MMRVERLVTPEAKSFCSTSSTRLPARAISRATATPLMPPPITTTWKFWPSRGGRGLTARLMVWSWMLNPDACRGGRFGRARFPQTPIIKSAFRRRGSLGNGSLSLQVTSFRLLTSEGNGGNRGLKPRILLDLYAALKRRSSTAVSARGGDGFWAAALVALPGSGPADISPLRVRALWTLGRAARAHCFFLNRPLNPLMGFCWPVPLPPMAFFRRPLAIPFTSGTNLGSAVVPSTAKGTARPPRAAFILKASWLEGLTVPPPVRTPMEGTVRLMLLACVPSGATRTSELKF